MKKEISKIENFFTMERENLERQIRNIKLELGLEL